MDYNVEKKEIILNKKLSKLDFFVINFTELLEEYVIVSGYVPILFGRSRSTEDVDLLIPQLSLEKFKVLWKKIYDKGFECINTSNVIEAYEMLREHAIRFCRLGAPTPNIEFKIIKNDLDKYSYQNKMKIIINQKNLFISPLELQIAYKLFLAADGSYEEIIIDKDIEDAKFLYKIFKEKLNKEEFLTFITKLNVKEKLRLIE